MRERLKEPRKGSEIDPEIICVQGVGADLFCDGVLFVERSNELLCVCKRKSSDERVVKASLNRATKVTHSRPETR